MTECHVQAVGQEGDEDVRLDAFFFLRKDRPDRQIALERFERFLDSDQLDESRVLLSPWHPWHGHTVLIFSSVAKKGQGVYHSGLESAQTDRPLEVPQWMFD